MSRAINFLISFGKLSHFLPPFIPYLERQAANVFAVFDILIEQVYGHDKSGRTSTKRANIDQPLRHITHERFVLLMIQLAIVEPRLLSSDFVRSRVVVALQIGWPVLIAL